jgi:regulatory protein
MAIFQRALSILAQRDHSAHELSQKLAQKGYAWPEIEAVILQLVAKNYLNDGRFAELYCEYRVAKGDGRIKIAHALQQRGISNPLIQQSLSVYQTQWTDLAAQACRQHFGATLPQNPAERQKQARFLLNRGFAWTEIQACFKR